MAVKEVIDSNIQTRGYKPRIGVELIDKSLLADPERHHGDNTPSEGLQGRVFSMQYGLRTVYWAAGSSQEAKASFLSREAPGKPCAAPVTAQ